MEINPTSLSSAQPLLDSAQLKSMTVDGALTVSQQEAEAARQFEAVLLRQISKNAFQPLFSGAMGGGSGGAVYEYFLTDAIAQGLSQGGGLGIASVIQQQLSRPEAASESSTPPQS
ncbi:MAG: rod-binding protein [Opitutales bacterium]